MHGPEDQQQGRGSHLALTQAETDPRGTIGRTRIVFRILAATSGQPMRPGGDTHPPTQRIDGFWSEQ